MTKSAVPPLDEPFDIPEAPAQAQAEKFVPVVASVKDDPEASRAQKNRFERTEASLKRQEQVRVRVPEDTTVQINGYGFYIAGKTTVSVPRQVAEILEQAGRI